MMEHVTSRQAICVWLFLVVASLFTAWVADDGVAFGKWTVVAVLLIALLKARAVILYYMEVRYAPWKLRLAFETWAWGVTVMVGVMLMMQ